MRISLVSTCTRSPACSILQCLGLRMAQGRFRNLRRACRNTAAFGGSCSVPCRFRSTKMWPTIEVETGRPSCRRSTASLSLPQHGYCWRRDKTSFGEFRRPRGLAHSTRAVRACLERGQIVTIKAPLPAIERLPADAEVPTGSSRIPSIEVIKQHPLKPCAARLKLIPSRCSHPDTLQSVTTYSERAHEGAALEIRRRERDT
jgi:hypothetical protein